MSKLIRGFGGGGGKGGGGSAHSPTEAADSIRSKQFARVVDLLGEGEIEGLVSGLASVYLDDTPVQNTDGGYNFSNVTIDYRYGTQDQSHISGFPSVESENSVGVEVTYATSVTRQITNQNLNRVRVTVGIPALYQQQSNGDLTGATVQYAIDLQSNGGGFVQITTTTISDKTSSRYQRSHELNLTGDAPWDIRVRRLTADSGISSLQNKTIWESYTEIVDTKLTYPNSAIVGLQIDASQFSSIPKRSYDVKLLKVKIPSNYDPILRTYTGLWDGTFSIAWTDNPAWCFYDLLTNERYGLGSYIDTSLVDTAQLYQIAQYCDEMVPDGFGGLEPRFTCNLYLQTREEAYRVIHNMASIFRGMTYWSTGSIFAVQDSPQDVFTQFTNADVINGEFTYSGSAGNTRHTVAMVSWNDPQDNYKQKIEYVEDTDAVVRFGVRETEFVAFGCTSRGQAHRAGKWLLYTEKYETETLAFKTSLKATSLLPGKIIQTMDNSRAGVRFGGRILSATTSSVVLDSSVVIESGKTYNINLILPDGSLVERSVTNSIGSHSTISFSPVLSDTPLEYSIWVISASDLSVEKWRVLAISEESKGIYTVNAISHYDGKFDLVDLDTEFEIPQTSYLTTTQSPVTGLVVTDTLYYLTQDVLGVRMMVSWVPPQGAVRYLVTYKTTGTSLVTIPTTSPSIDINNVLEGDYEISVTAYNVLGVPSSTTTTNYTLLGRFTPPSDIPDLKINVLGENSYLSWTSIDDLDWSHCKIKYSPAVSGVTWTSSSTLVEKISKSSTTTSVPSMVGTYLIKAVDYYGVESENATSVISTISGLTSFNVVELVTENPTFSGTKVNTDVVSSTLRLSSEHMSDWASLSAVTTLLYGTSTELYAYGEYYFGPVDLSQVYPCRVYSDIESYGANLTNTMSTWVSLDSVADMDGSIASDWSITLQVRRTDDDPAGTPTWTSWADFIIGDYSARGFEFRLLLYSYSPMTTPIVSKLAVSIDMPDRTYGETDLSCTAGGISVTYVPPFKNSPSIAIAAQGLATGDYYEITSKTRSGFTIKFKNSGGSDITRTFDYVAKGYGQDNT